MFSLSANEITVPAGGEAQVDVTADTRKGTVDGAYSGAVVATAGESATRTPVAVVREVESYDLTLNYIDENGAPTADYSTLIVGLDNRRVRVPVRPGRLAAGAAAQGRVHRRPPRVHRATATHYNVIAQPGLAARRRQDGRRRPGDRQADQRHPARARRGC